MVETIDVAEKCVKYLRDNNVGVATFIALDKVSDFEFHQRSC